MHSHVNPIDRVIKCEETVHGGSRRHGDLLGKVFPASTHLLSVHSANV